MTELEYYKILAQILGEDTEILFRYLNLMRLTDVAVKALFIRGECTGPLADAIREQLISLNDTGYWTWIK